MDKNEVTMSHHGHILYNIESLIKEIYASLNFVIEVLVVWTSLIASASHDYLGLFASMHISALGRYRHLPRSGQVGSRE